MPRRAYLLTAAVCLFLGGCGGPRTNYKYRIAVIPKGLTHEHWQSVERGARRAAAELAAQGVAVEILYDGPTTEGDALQQISLIQQKTGMGIHGLVLAPQDSKQMVPAVKDAVAKGVPVVIIDSGLDPEALKENPDLIVKYVATDNYHGGELAADHLLRVLAGEDKEAPGLVLFRYTPGSESTEQREQGFLDRVNKKAGGGKKAGQPAVRWLSTDKYAGPTVDSAEREAGPLLIQLKDREPDGIFAVNESATSGMLNALRSQGLNQKVHLMGFDSSEPLLQALREKDVDGLVVQDPYRMGFFGVWMLVQHLEGYDVGSDGKTFSTGEYLVTRENLDQEATRERFDPALQARRTFKLPAYKKRAANAPAK